MELRDRVAVVLGAGSIAEGIGIGRAIAMDFARHGARVVAADRDADAATETVAAIALEGGFATPAVVDVCDDAALTEMLGQVEAAEDRIDILHCNVGLGRSGPSADTTPAEWRRIADANLTALHVAAQAVLPGMRARGRGVILVTSSIAGVRDVGYPHLAYGTTKAAAIQFARLLASEVAPDGIRVNAIVAGLIDTPRIGVTLANAYGGLSEAEMRARRHAQCPLGRMGSAWDVAHAATFLASDRAGYITGAALVVDGGLSNAIRQPAG
ncbi:SDR family NAD(P)-dependent oxidoreductase [Rhodobaculum claviforme]|uniref:3-oxoacyl-ACP reductase n=1 Tax=Rhodobaculum claviforme TaxID=1549854 RepID=A0A934TJ57_9RHOB|nr:SDR family NAD(P)-dependent oxidoreductase [Rhodobaculum claviforme]MBK5926740.1 3-oxoacyl-ACP reductase [Rhodobaculum claviforme]